jgi:putative ABC transport system permease protein
MSLVDALRYRWRVLRHPRSYDRDVDEEFRFHLSLDEMQHEHAARSGRDAAWRARRRFGNPTYHKEERRTMSGLGFFDTAMQDLRFASRMLRHTPGFTAVTIVTLALGIGANTAIFSAIDVMILRPLPFAAPDRLMEIAVTVPPRNGQPAADDAPWSYLKAVAFREGQHVFSLLGLYTNETVTLRGGEPTREESEVVDEHYLPTLGISPSLGRNFLAEENRPHGTRAVLVSENFWNRSLDADSSVLGRTVDIEGEPYTIVGVLPHGFHGLGGRAELWTTIGARRAYQFEPNEAWDHEFRMIGRLAAGVTPERARGDVAVAGLHANALYALPQDQGRWGATARLLDRARVDPTVRRSLLVLFGAALFVLLIACANLANLFLLRASARQREIAVRLAIGASRRRLVRQLLTESLLLAALGGVASLVVAWAGVRVLSTLNPQSTFAAQRLGGLGAVNFGTIHLDARALAFAIGAALFTGVLFGLVPAIQATRPRLTDALKEGTSETPSASPLLRRVTTRNVLVVVELALALVLLAGSGVMVRSLSNLLGVSPGFDPANVLTLRLTSAQSVRARDSLPVFYQTLISELRALPGVISVAAGNCPPLAGGCNQTMIFFRDRPAPALGTDPLVGVHWVTPDWFRTLRVPLLSGRGFTDADRLGARRVVLVNATAARRFWPAESPIGHPIGVGQGGFDTAYVVGVVGDVRFETIDSLPAADVYLPYYQSPRNGGIFYLRTSVPPGTLSAAARRTIHGLAADLPVYDVRTMAARVGDATTEARFSALLLALFAGAALVLATLGIYGVISYAVAQRTREIGIRVALGADQARVLRLIVGQGLALTGAGITLGIAVAIGTTHVLRSLLYNVTPRDPATFAVVIALLTIAAIAASVVPGRRAARLQPSAALRE